MTNNSQSSDNIFSDTEVHCDITMNIDDIPYESLMSNTKAALVKSIYKDAHKPFFSTYFMSLMEDCRLCISQALELVNQILADTEVKFAKLFQNLEDTVVILQLLASFIKNVIATVSMSCRNTKTFPTTIGNIILIVFTHCRESETVYGSNLACVERQLKDLFRNCHDLQLTYLMLLEKRFLFDLVENDDLDILLEALDINLKIGEIVQSLDVKTMAEQWKAYTMICEKYSSYLKDKHIFVESTKILSSMIQNNIKTAIEINQNDKMVTRSLKVANFTIKILLKVCSVFKCATSKKCDYIMDLILFIYINNPEYLDLKTQHQQKSTGFAHLLNVNVMNPTDILLQKLLTDETFVLAIVDLETHRLKSEDALGYILLILAAIKHVLQNKEALKISKQELVNCIYKFVPYGHVWFNIGLKFRLDSDGQTDLQTCGLYERLLSYSYALATTFNMEEMNHLELNMYQSLLSTDCYVALFSANLWRLLARSSTRPFLLTQLIVLCKTFEQLEATSLFYFSPQRIYLSHTISGIFSEMHNEDKIRLYKQYSPNDDKNNALWSVLKIKNLPEDVQCEVEEIVADKLNTKFHAFFTFGLRNTEEFDTLINTMSLASTCSFLNGDCIENNVVKAWTKACLNKECSLHRNARDMASGWFLKYVAALACLSSSIKYLFRRSENVWPVLHIISGIIENGNRKVKIVIIKLLVNITLHPISNGNRNSISDLLIHIFKTILKDSDILVKHMFYNILRSSRPNRNIDSIINKVIEEDNSIQHTINSFTKCEDFSGCADLKECLMGAMHEEYRHTCYENIVELDCDSASTMAKGSNFEFADIDSLLEVESDSEPACKKMKLNTNRVEEILTRIENETALLLQHTVFASEHKNRLRSIREKLQIILE